MHRLATVLAGDGKRTVSTCSLKVSRSREAKGGRERARRTPSNMSSSELNEMVLKCEKTGKLFFTQEEAKQHGDDTGFAEFAQALGTLSPARPTLCRV